MDLSEIEPSLRQLADRIRGGRRFVLVTHVQPDGDGIGALLALNLVLRSLGKMTYPTWGEPIDVPPQYAWLPGVSGIKQPAEAPAWENLIAVDCAGRDRLGVLTSLLESVEFSASLDHHKNGGRFAGLNIVAPEASAACEMVFELAKVLGVTITSDMATCLYVGMLTDTGRFQYSNTSGRVLRVAADLLDIGLDPVGIFRNVYEGLSFGTTVLLGRVLAGAKFEADTGLVWGLITQKDIVELGARMAESENFVDFLRAVDDARVAALIRETKDGEHRVSLRSPGVIDVARLAASFGGGGHRDAAGYSSSAGFEETLASLRRAIEALSGATGGLDTTGS